MNALRCLVVLAALLSATTSVAAREEPDDGPFAVAIDAGRERVVKLYGGEFGRERGYGSGVLISPDGRIVTTLSILLESPALRAVLPDGRRFPARVVKRDQSRQLALLRIEADQLASFELGGSAHLRAGDWLIAAANPFKVADGPEPVSIAVGVFSGRAELSARRRTQDFAYAGPVLLSDIIVTAPGSAGGALLDLDGRLVGVIGKAVVSSRTNTWVNYALPVEQVAAFVSDTSAAAAVDVAVEDDGANRRGRPDLGIRLFDVGGRTRPAYVERVRPDSPAHEAGIRPNDLILSLAGESVGTCADYYDVLGTLRIGGQIPVVIKRGDETRSVELTVGGRER